MALAPLQIPYTPIYMSELNALVHGKEVLASAGYVTKELTPEDLEMKKRCLGCGKPMGKFRLRREKINKLDAETETRSAQYGVSAVQDQGMAFPTSYVHEPNHTEPRMRCQFHSGQLQAKVWTCCGARPKDPPCAGLEFHWPGLYAAGVIEALWQYHRTPPGLRTKSYREAVAIDCEMGTSLSGDSELIRVTLLDYFSGAILVDNLVWPDVPMLHFNTRYSGVRASDMHKARRTRTCFFGKDDARKAILGHVCPDTIVVGHGANNDLNSLRWIHLKVVDTLLLASAQAGITARCEDAKDVEAVNDEEGVDLVVDEEQGSNGALSKAPENKKQAGGPKKRSKGSGRFSLKTLAKERLGRDIQMGRNGHDSVEDALAARDLVHSVLTSQGGHVPTISALSIAD